MFPDHVIFVSKMFLTPQSIKNLPIPTPTQINALNIAKAAITITQIGKKLGVIKPSMWMICHRSSSQKLHILVVTTYINNRTASQNAQRSKKQLTKQRAICYINGDSGQW
jgi:Co/Zn/Cd efflux system component